MSTRLASELAESTGGLKVVWDAGNGAAGEAMALLTRICPARHVLLNETIDGTFPAHHPDPTEPEEPGAASGEVARQKLDIGIAFDGDGDRIGVVDAKGRILWGDQMLVDAGARRAEGQARRDDHRRREGEPGAVRRDRPAGGKPLMWKTGHSLIKAKMAETGSPLARRDERPHLFRRPWYGFDDALYAAVRLLRRSRAMAAIWRPCAISCRALVNTPELRFDCADARKFAVVEEVRDRLAQQAPRFNDIDGVRVQTAGWLVAAARLQHPGRSGRPRRGERRGGAGAAEG